MKKSLNFISRIAVILMITPIIFMTACSQGGLVENTSGSLGPESFYESKRDFDAAIIPMYSYFQNAFFNAQGQEVMYAGDDITTRPGGNKGQFRNWDQFNYQSHSGWLDQFAYEPYWKTIHVANTILENIKNPPSSLSEDYINHVKGQAHFMRGVSYYMLVRQFGNIPEITTPEAPEKVNRSTVLSNYKLIEKDLKFAASHLPAVWPSGTKGKATSGAARTALASLYLTWAGWPVKDKSKYALAASEAKKVMDSGTYELLSNFANFWKPEYNNNKEAIFSIQYDYSANQYTSRMSQSYGPVEQKGWVDGEAEIGLFKRMPPGPRKKATYLTTFTTADGEKINWKASQFAHPTFQKWTAGGMPNAGRPTFDGAANVALFRYAEVLLIYAEAEDMANGGPNTLAYNAINKVRERAGIPDLPKGLSKMEFKKAVVRERSYEFAGEYTRWFDEVRTETVKKWTDLRSPKELPVINEPQAEPTVNIYISPIPNVDILRSGIKQNGKGGFKIR